MRKLPEPAHLVLACLALSAVLLQSSVRAMTLDFDSVGPQPPPKVTCTLQEGDITVSSFAGILGYKLRGDCSVSFPNGAYPPIPIAPFEGGGSWTESTGMVNEFLKGRDAKGHLWEIHGGGTCKLDPWMTGRAGAQCSTGNVSFASPNAPKNLVKKLGVPLSPELLSAQARGWLTGKTIAAILAEHQAPKFLMPSEGSTAAGATVSFKVDPGPGSPSKTFLLEWQAKVNGQWTSKNVTEALGLSELKLDATKFGASSNWRLRARAYQTNKAKWSDWRSFKTTPPTPSCTPVGTNNASYGVAGMPATLKAGLTTTVPITVTNLGSAAWGMKSSYHLSYHWLQGAATIVFDGERTTLPAAVAPCQTITLSATVKGPPSAGSYTIQWDMVLENVTWFSNQGVPTGNRAVTVTP